MGGASQLITIEFSVRHSVRINDGGMHTSRVASDRCRVSDQAQSRLQQKRSLSLMAEPGSSQAEAKV